MSAGAKAKPEFKGMENDALMAAVGAPYFEPFPPQHMNAALRDPDARPFERFMAAVYSSTFAFGHRYPYCVDKEGHTRTLKWFEENLGYSRDWVLRLAAEAERKGFIKREKDRIGVVGKPLPFKGQSGLSPLSSTEPSECTLRELVAESHWAKCEKWRPEVQKEFADELVKIDKDFATEAAAVMTAVRERKAMRLEKAYTKRALEWKRPERKPKSSDKPVLLAQLAFVLVAPKNGSVHSEDGNGLHTPVNGSVRADHPYRSENYQKANSSSSLPPRKPETTTIPDKPWDDPEPEPEEPSEPEPMNKGGFRKRLIKLCLDFGISGTPTVVQSEEVYRILPPAARLPWLADAESRSKLKKWKNPGVLLHDAEGFAAGWPERQARIAAERERVMAAEEGFKAVRAEAALRNEWLAEVEANGWHERVSWEKWSEQRKKKGAGA